MDEAILDALVSAISKRLNPPPPPAPAPEPDPPPPPPLPRKRRKTAPATEAFARPVHPTPPSPRKLTRWDRTLAAWRKKHGGGRIPERGTEAYEDLLDLYYKTK